MTGASEFIQFEVGGVSITAFVTPEELLGIESGAVVDVTLRHVVAVHLDVGEQVPFRDLRCTFVGGEPSPFVPVD
ncbi:hypothetical protein D3875_09925 [Deinococcus cavernae]|uniref:Uncharacterized protein n=1 Tax=Deinococcus cavernae TaxID=2320857 RepID=A0A418V6Z2_9DEIO|nr:hypothetical protein [Deinococcus cavernae]RJF71830.1 hypothetical protein D3875_09925 [Deinococcus cavernae]